MGRRRGTNRRARGTHAVRQTRAQAAAIRELTASTSNSDNNNNNVVADITVHAVDGVADTSLGSHGNQARTSTTAVSSSATAVLSSAQPSTSTSTATATSPTASGIGGATGGVGGFALPVSTQQVQQNQWQWGHGQQQSASSGIQGNGEQIQNQNVVGNVGLLSGLHGQSQVNMSLNALTTVCAPLGVGVPQNLKEKIVKGEFIELGQLLDATEPKKVFNFTLNMNNKGQLLWEDGRPKRRITSIHMWTNAFLIFSAVFLEAHPHRTQELLKYMSLVRTAASRYQGFGWRDYDKHFRMRQQVQPLRSWASIDSELWSLYAASGPVMQYGYASTASTTTSSSSNVSGSAGIGPMRSSFRKPSQFTFSKPSPFTFRTGGNAPRQQFSTQGPFGPTCFAFNGAGCARAQCRFQHKCFKCKGTGHGAASCKTSK